MESNVMFSGFSPRMLTLEMPQNPQNPVQFQHPHPHPYTTTADQHPQQPLKTLYPYTSSSKPIQLSPISPGDEDDRGSGSGSGCNHEESTGTDGKKKLSQWHRMKWTDTMVRLLIMAVFYIGDEAGLIDPIDAKKKIGPNGPSGGPIVGMLQKKGKWKSVSRAMVEKGFSVSPQQCEDKFNDLNKRYKRVNDILGKGTACEVVENHGLLETMTHLTPKLKDEVKKLLNSKHLFFREMCAYHNSCGHLTTDQSQPQTQSQTQTQSCFHVGEPRKMASIAESEEEESEEELETEMEESEEDEVETRKKRRKCDGEVKRLREETTRVWDDHGKSVWEKKEWMRRKVLELEEKKVGYDWEAVEMEKQKVKWLRYRSKKEREMEKAMLENQRRRLETERMVLILKRREIELQSLGKRVDPSCGTGLS